jgi:hypothetical protein
MRPHPLAAALVAGALAGGCASAACVPSSVVVDRKEERKEMRSEFRGMRTGPTGTVTDDRREVIVTEYWVRGRDGRWYEVNAGQFAAVEPGQTLSLCRVPSPR